MTKGQKISITKRSRAGQTPAHIARVSKIPFQKVLAYIEKQNNGSQTGHRNAKREGGDKSGN